MSTYSSYPEGYRATEVQTVLAAVQRGECAAVLGLSGAGKSNLLGFLAQRAGAAAAHERVFIDCNRLAEASAPGFWSLLLRGLTGSTAPLTSDVWTALESSLAARLAAPGSRLCLVLDRFDALPPAAEPPIYGGLRALRDEHKYALTYVIGARRALNTHSELAELFYANTLWLGPLATPDARWSAESYAVRARLHWDETVLQRVAALSGGYPALLRAVCEAHAAGCPLESADLRRHAAVQRRLAEFWAAGPTAEELRLSRLTEIALLALPTTGAPAAEPDTGTLTAKELRLWQALRDHPGQVCEKDDLIRAVWPEDRILSQGVRDDSLAQLIRRLRQKIETNPDQAQRIHTVPGRGYKYEPPQPSQAGSFREPPGDPMKKLFLPLLVLIFVSMACSVGFDLPGLATATPQESTEAVIIAATAAPSRTPAPTSKPNATPAPTQARPTAPPAQATPIVIPAGGEQPVLITGDFLYSNSFVVETYYVEQAVALLDMHGFVLRDREWELPVESQVLGFLKINTTRKQGTYRLQLPLIPAGMYTDFTNSGGKKPGVQIFAVAYAANLAGGPFSEGDDRSRGWPSYLASVVTDTENKDEVVSGKLVVWAPDDQEQFPTGFGSDGLLFTTDDPLGPLPAGYSVIDLDHKPFDIDRSMNPKLPLYEPKDVAIKDYSKLSYSAAFQNMFDFLKTEYAFNGIPGKEPAWDSLYAAIMPRVKDAEQKKDGNAYFAALSDFTLGFKDGHVSVDGGAAGRSVTTQRMANGYGFAIRELDDKRVIVVYVGRGTPAQTAGLAVGDEIVSFNDVPIGQAIGNTQVLSPYSSDFGLRYEQAHFLLRAAAVGAPATITFKNKNGASKTATLKAVAERNSYYATSIFRNYDDTALPVEFRILDSGSGYVKINSNYDDLNLIIRLFERALKTFESNGVQALIIDMRTNTGGSPLGLAGYLTNQEIPLGRLEYYNTKTGKFEPDRETDTFTPNENQYRFKKMALLVDQACFSACEIEAYGFSKVPGMVVVGMYPSGGVEAEVARGQFELPGGMSAQFPTGRFVLPDGSLFLEGRVRPTVRVPITAENVLSQEDVVLAAAEERLK